MLRRGRNRGNDSKAGKRVVVSGKIDVSIRYSRLRVVRRIKKPIILFVLRWLAAFPLSLGQVKELIKVIGRAHGLDFFRSQIVNDWTKDGATSKREIKISRRRMIHTTWGLLP